MKQRIFLFISVFLYFILIFLFGKIAFFLIRSSMGGDVGVSDLLEVLYHGLPLDLSMSGYLMAIPALMFIFSIWIKPEYIARVCNVYFLIILSLISIITVVDITVYPHWGFHFDSTVFLYLQKPKEVFASATPLEFVVGIIATIAFAAILFIGYIYIIRKQVVNLQVPKSIAKTSIVLVLLTAALFLPIRGGVTVSTMNIGHVYFSDNTFLNHAAINPEFNLMASMFKSDNFGDEYQFFDREEAEQIFVGLNRINDTTRTDSIRMVLTTDRPNIILFLLESFSYNVALDSVVAPNMSRFAQEGILFDHFYANSFRTDRGIVSVLSGYPAHPTVAMMKYPKKTESLPTIPRALRKSGYDNFSFYYGGDADFANMGSYFVGACGISDVVSDKNFPLSERMTKWGVPDKQLIERFYRDLTTEKQESPFFKTVLTLSSHEPFDVPVTRFDHPFLNAVNYTDSCLGDFVNKLKTTDLWDNTLIIFVADHTMRSYPEGRSNDDPDCFHVPMVWLGGALNQHGVVNDFASQNDLAATLLSQLGIKHDQFKFSKDVFNTGSRKFAFYSYMNGFTMMDSTGVVTYDNDRQEVIRQEGNPELEKQAKGFFQNMYIDLGNR